MSSHYEMYHLGQPQPQRGGPGVHGGNLRGTPGHFVGPPPGVHQYQQQPMPRAMGQNPMMGMMGNGTLPQVSSLFAP